MPSPDPVLRTLPEVCDPRHTALLVVDMQNDFFSPDGAFAQAGLDVASSAAIAAPLGRLVEDAHAAGVLVVLISMVIDPDGRVLSGPERARRERRTNRIPYVIEGTWGCELVPEIPVRPEALRVRKHRASAFIGTDLEMALRAGGVRSVVVAGVVTNGCVLATARDAFMHDFYTVVARDLVASPSADLHEAALKLLAESWGDELLPAGSDLARLWAGRGPVR